MQAETLDKLIWPLVYVGLGVMALGLAVAGSSAATALAWTLIGGGTLAVAAGVVLLVVRSRIDDEDR